MTTPADNKITEAKSNIDTAIKCLSEIVVDKIHGSDEFRDDYLKKLKSSMFSLIDIRETLS